MSTAVKKERLDDALEKSYDAEIHYLRKMDRIATGMPDLKVTLPEKSGKGQVAFSDVKKRHIFINLGRVEHDTSDYGDFIRVMEGVNYHELSHILFTPVRKLPERITGEAVRIHKANNILEDARIESLFGALYPSVRDYFRHAVYNVILTGKSATMGAAMGRDPYADAYPLLYGRRSYLPANIIAASREGWEKAHPTVKATDIESVVDRYLVEEDVERRWKLGIELAKLLKEATAEPPEGCGMGEGGEGEGESSDGVPDERAEKGSGPDESKERTKKASEKLKKDLKDSKDALDKERERRKKEREERERKERERKERGEEKDKKGGKGEEDEESSAEEEDAEGDGDADGGEEEEESGDDGDGESGGKGKGEKGEDDTDGGSTDGEGDEDGDGKSGDEAEEHSRSSTGIDEKGSVKDPSSRKATKDAEAPEVAEAPRESTLEDLVMDERAKAADALEPSVRDAIKAIETTVPAFAQKKTGKAEFADFNEAQKNVVRAIVAELKAVTDDARPGWVGPLRSGKLDIRRVMQADRREVFERNVFKKYRPSVMRATKLAVAISIDTSGSMSGVRRDGDRNAHIKSPYSKAERACVAANILETAVERAGGKVSVGIFGDEAHILKGFRDPASVVWNDCAATGGGTEEYAILLEQAQRLLDMAKNEGYSNLVHISITDGQWVKGSTTYRGSTFNPEEVHEALRQKGIVTVELGIDMHSSNGADIFVPVDAHWEKMVDAVRKIVRKLVETSVGKARSMMSAGVA